MNQNLFTNTSLETHNHPLNYMTLLKAGIRVCASQKENTSLGPVIKSFGVSPLKKDPKPSLRIMFETIRKPPSGFSKFLF
jgi:hypothetical protein